MDAAVEFLGKAQAPDGTYADDTVEPGMTAVVTTGLLRAGRGVNEPLVAKGLKYIAAQVKPDGGIHGAGTHFQNYETCLSVLCLSEGNRDGRYNRILKAAEQFIKKDQWGADESVDKTNLNYGDDRPYPRWGLPSQYAGQRRPGQREVDLLRRGASDTPGMPSAAAQATPLEWRIFGATDVRQAFSRRNNDGTFSVPRRHFAANYRESSR